MEPRGDISGETAVRVQFPVPGKRLPVRFGIPLGQVPSARNVALFDEAGDEIPADVFPLVNFETSPPNWVLVAVVLDAPPDGEATLVIRWGPHVERSVPERTITASESPDEVRFSGGVVEFTLSDTELISTLQSGEQVFGAAGGSVGFEIRGTPTEHSAPLAIYRHEPGETAIVKLYDGPFYKRYRISSTFFHSRTVSRPFRLHLEVETWADSPYLLIHSRLINETLEETMSDLVMFSLAPGGDSHVASVSGEDVTAHSGGEEMSVRQRRDEWVVRADGRDLATGLGNNLGSWARISRSGEAVTLAVPDFQGFGPAEPDLESVLTASSSGSLELRHYTPLQDGEPLAGEGGTITFWNSMARTFQMAPHVGPESQSGVGVSGPMRQPPSIRYDREFLTSQGTFAEDRVTHLYDEVTLEGTRYFDRARALRQDYPRLGRGMPPQVGEGFEMPYTNTGGMMFGELWQYMEPNGAWNESWIPRQKSKGNLPAWYEPVQREGFGAYRMGDHSMAMALSYLRTGDRQVFEIFRDHSLLYADWAVAHPSGSVHYYPQWTGKSHVYVRLAGPIIAYLVSGDPWLLETAEQMGSYLVRHWGDRDPGDRESRSAYPARGLGEHGDLQPPRLGKRRVADADREPVAHRHLVRQARPLPAPNACCGRTAWLALYRRRGLRPGCHERRTDGSRLRRCRRPVRGGNPGAADGHRQRRTGTDPAVVADCTDKRHLRRNGDRALATQRGRDHLSDLARRRRARYPADPLRGPLCHQRGTPRGRSPST